MMKRGLVSKARREYEDGVGNELVIARCAESGKVMSRIHHALIRNVSEYWSPQSNLFKAV